MNADRAAATAHPVRDWQTGRAVFVQFPARFFNRLVRAATRREGTHDLFHANLQSPLVLRRHAATYIAFRDNADQLEVLRIGDHGRATAA